MPRRARVIVPGYPNHVVHRGNNRCGVFCDKHDYLVYLDWLRKYSEEALCTVHAYVLMSNHVHILVSPAFEDGLFRLMKPLAQRYAQHFNTRYKAHRLPLGRPVSFLVDPV
ncbi:hypothetical protein E4L96_17695 [Massilia arenosa]|uniref:Transposase IS200-like domain-containing protein n=1 Tax=Zemynaea arenosa TaxID=2561931 RepID=A0A4Y9S5J1_9BURK|nr:hypothetical protein E4L96_17695 [Massilia arenosa]